MYQQTNPIYQNSKVLRDMVLLLQLHMKYHPLPFPHERDQVITEIILDGACSTAEIKSLSHCRGMLQCIFLSDLVTADERYLENFVFDPGPFKRGSYYCYPQEGPTKGDWDT